MSVVRKLALAGVLCVAAGLPAPASADPDPATCQAIKPVIDEIVAAAVATGKGIDPGPSPSFPPGYDPAQEILGHYRKAGEAARAAADKTPDPHVAELLRRMSDAFGEFGTDETPGGIVKKPSEDEKKDAEDREKDGDEFAALGKECGYVPDRKQLGG
ncbi:hypothetical protein [Segniliparus rugosus]|uniref:Hemophore-related protein n=1 Tax=Segniliparus rugosus (strain ATCC BAA-974 / DSM 45345 / CCUG 50838 / CIP 108380 / JCM 13579 / CDC 945) TaxID=679197 RepID=E5XMW8_SEGRC|nr:hypothetical protein [Segniliparus rugosus]EFV14312.1 hypothetical protein HMPREF9336_00838 [Segniliparus rugosus ATCC BAA-974]